MHHHYQYIQHEDTNSSKCSGSHACMYIVDVKSVLMAAGIQFSTSEFSALSSSLMVDFGASTSRLEKLLW